MSRVLRIYLVTHAWFWLKHTKQNPLNRLENLQINPISDTLNQLKFIALKDRSMSVQEAIRDTITKHPIVLFMKGTAQFPMCGFSGRVIQILQALEASNVVTVNVLDNQEVREGIKEYSNWPTIPQLYVKGEFIGGCDIVTEMYQNGELKPLLDSASSDHQA